MGFHFIVDGHASALTTSAEHTLDDHVVSLVYCRWGRDFDGAGTVLEQKPKGRLAFPVRDRLNLSHGSEHDHRLLVIVVRVGDQFGHLKQAGTAQ